MLDLLLLGHGSDLFVLVLFGFRTELAVLVRKPRVLAPLGRIGRSAAYAITGEVFVSSDDIAILESVFTTSRISASLASSLLGFRDVVRLGAAVLSDPCSRRKESIGIGEGHVVAKEIDHHSCGIGFGCGV